MRAADQWAEIEESLPPEWAENCSPSRPKDRSQTLLRSSGRSSRDVSERSFGSTSRGRTGARSARATSSGGSTGGGSGARSHSSGSRRKRTPIPPHRMSPQPRRSSRAGTSASPSSHPTGAIFCASSSLTRATTSPVRALLGAPLNPTRVVDANALRFRCSRKAGLWCLARDGASLLRAHGRGGDRGASHDRAGSLGHRERRNAGPGLARRRTLGLKSRPLADDLRGTPSCRRPHGGRTGTGACPPSRASPSRSGCPCT